MNVATDVVPLLAHTCSPECLQQLPDGADGYIKQPHQGGLGLEQPEKQTFGGKNGGQVFHCHIAEILWLL